MPDVTISIPTAQVDRVKTAFINWYNLDPAISNADLLTFAKGVLRDHVRAVVRDAEARELTEAANDQASTIDSTEVAS